MGALAALHTQAVLIWMTLPAASDEGFQFRRPQRVRHDQRGQVQWASSCSSRPHSSRMGQRLRSRNLLDLAYQVNPHPCPASASREARCSQFVGATGAASPGDTTTPWRSDVLERGYGIIVWQEQVVQLLVERGGDDRR